jgi:hypothetical protein
MFNTPPIKCTPTLLTSAITKSLATILRLGVKKDSGVFLRPPATADAIQMLRANAIATWGEAVPDEFTDMLKSTNGVQINGAYFKEAENFVLENRDVFDPRVMVLGNSGSVDWYVFDRQDRQFHITTLGSPSDRFGTFQTFDELLNAVLYQQQVV